jgi:hypothetical protein
MRQIVYLFAGMLTISFDGHAYNWQQHVPPAAQSYIPNHVTSDSESSDQQGRPIKKPDVHYGPTQISGLTMSSLTVYGPLTINASLVFGSTEVCGPLSATNSDFGHITIKGPFSGRQITFDTLDAAGSVSLENARALGSIALKGLLNADGCSLNDIDAYTNLMLIKRSQVVDIVIRKQDAWQETWQGQVVELIDSQVRSIRFEGGHGKVMIDKQSSCPNVEGGTIIMK